RTGARGEPRAAGRCAVRFDIAFRQRQDHCPRGTRSVSHSPPRRTRISAAALPSAIARRGRSRKGTGGVAPEPLSDATRSPSFSPALANALFASSAETRTANLAGATSTPTAAASKNRTGPNTPLTRRSVAVLVSLVLFGTRTSRAERREVLISLA